MDAISYAKGMTSQIILDRIAGLSPDLVAIRDIKFVQSLADDDRLDQGEAMIVDEETRILPHTEASADHISQIKVTDENNVHGYTSSIIQRRSSKSDQILARIALGGVNNSRYASSGDSSRNKRRPSGEASARTTRSRSSTEISKGVEAIFNRESLANLLQDLKSTMVRVMPSLIKKQCFIAYGDAESVEYLLDASKSFPPLSLVDIADQVHT